MMSITEFVRAVPKKVWVFLGLLSVNFLVWLPMIEADFLTIGLSHDSQIFSSSIHAYLRQYNGVFDPVSTLFLAREPISSYPYFGVLYPFYFTLGLHYNFTFEQNLMLDFASVCFHLLVGSIGFYCLVKRLGGSFVVALFFCVFYAYSQHLMMWSSWIWAISGYAWIPFALLGVLELFSNRRTRGVAFLGGGMGMIALGTALPLIYAFVLVGVFALYLLLERHKHANFPGYIPLVVGGLLAGLLAFSLGASHLIPVISHSDEYVRWYSGGAIVGSFKPPYEATLSVVIPATFEGVSQFFVPSMWFGVGHPFLAPIVFMGFISFCCFNIRRPSLYLILFSVFYFYLDGFGDATPVHRLTYQIPLLNSVRYPIANTFVAQFLVLLFSALGLSNLVAAVSSNGKKKAALVAISVVHAVWFLYLIYDHQELIRGFRELGIEWYVAGVTITFGGFVALIRQRFDWWLLCILASLLPLHSMAVHPKIPQKNSLYSECSEFANLLTFLKHERSKLSGTPRLAILPGTDFKQPLSSNGCLKKHVFGDKHFQSIAMTAGWGVMQIYLSPRDVNQFRLTNRLIHPHRFDNINSLYSGGITHVMGRSGAIKNSDDKVLYKVVGHVVGMALYEVVNSELAGIAVGCLRKDVKGSLTFIAAQGVRTLGRTPEGPQLGKVCSGDSLGSVDQLDISGNRLLYKVHVAEESLFLTDQVFSDSWDVKIDGNTSKALLVDDYRTGVLVPAGESLVELSFRDAAFYYSRYLTWAGFLIILLLLVYEYFNCLQRWLGRSVNRI